METDENIKEITDIDPRAYLEAVARNIDSADPNASSEEKLRLLASFVGGMKSACAMFEKNGIGRFEECIEFFGGCAKVFNEMLLLIIETPTPDMN